MTFTSLYLVRAAESRVRVRQLHGHADRQHAAAALRDLLRLGVAQRQQPLRAQRVARRHVLRRLQPLRRAGRATAA